MTINATSRIKTGQFATGVTGVTGAAPQTVAAAKLDMSRVEVGTLSALCYGKATTTSMTLTVKWQVSYSGSAWYDATTSTSIARVVLASQAGTDTVTAVICAPENVYGMPWARCVIVSAGATGAGAGTDEASISYTYRAAPEGQRGKIRPLGASQSASALVGNAGTTVSGGVVNMTEVKPGTLGALVYALSGTASLTIDGKWQVSNDNTTWYDAKGPDNRANLSPVASTAGTTTFLTTVAAPPSVYGWRYARYALVTAGATAVGGSTDQYSIAHHYQSL